MKILSKTETKCSLELLCLYFKNIPKIRHEFIIVTYNE